MLRFSCRQLLSAEGCHAVCAQYWDKRLALFGSDARAVRPMTLETTAAGGDRRALGRVQTPLPRASAAAAASHNDDYDDYDDGSAGADDVDERDPRWVDSGRLGSDAVAAGRPGLFFGILFPALLLGRAECRAGADLVVVLERRGEFSATGNRRPRP